MKPGTFSTEPISFEHPQHGLVRAAVQRAVERRRGAGERRIRIGLRAADAAHRARAAVLLVIGVQDEQHVERALEHRVRPVLQLGHLEQHVQEVAGEAQVVVRIDVRPADAVTIGVGGDASAPWRSGGGSAAARDVLVADLLRVRVERRERADRARKMPIGWASYRKPSMNFLMFSWSIVCSVIVVRPRFELRRGRQLAEQDQVGGLEIACSARPAARWGSRGSAGCPCRRR